MAAHSPEIGYPAALVFVRHGKSEGNLAHEYARMGISEYAQQLVDSGKDTYEYRLVDEGIKQAEIAGQWLREHVFPEFDHYYTSDLIRTKETASHLKFPDALWDSETDIREQYPGPKKPRATEDSFVLDRTVGVKQFLNEIFKTCNGKRVLVVCHATTIRSFIICLENLQYKSMTKLNSYPILTVENCQIIWYSRSDPSTGEIVSPVFRWRTTAIPYKHNSDTPLKWEKISKKLMDNEDLLRNVERIPRIIQIKSDSELLKEHM